MITFLAYAVLSVLIVVAVRAFALAIAKFIVRAWVRLYTIFSSEEGKWRREEVLSDLYEHITDSRNEGYAPVETAFHILFRFVTGIRDDLAWCAPLAPSMLAIKATRLSESLSSFRTPKVVIPSLAVFGFFNWAFFSSGGDRTLVMWSGLNVATVAMIVLFSKQQHAWARRVLYTLIGTAGITALGFMAWWIGPAKLYELIELPMFRGFLIGMTALGLAMLAADKSIRARLFKGRWLYVVTCWLLIIVVSLVASVALAGNVTPLLSAWATAAIFVASLFVFCGIITLLAAAFWFGCLRGSVAGLRLVAAGLRHL